MKPSHNTENGTRFVVLNKIGLKAKSISITVGMVTLEEIASVVTEYLRFDDVHALNCSFCYFHTHVT